MSAVAPWPSRQFHRRLAAVALGGLVTALSACHAIKTQLGMNAGAASSSATTPTGTAASSQASPGGKKVHLGGGGKGAPGLIESLGQSSHDSRETSNFDASPYGVTPPRFLWRSHDSPSQDRPGRHHL